MYVPYVACTYSHMYPLQVFDNVCLSTYMCDMYMCVLLHRVAWSCVCTHRSIQERDIQVYNLHPGQVSYDHHSPYKVCDLKLKCLSFPMTRPMLKFKSKISHPLVHEVNG